MQNKNTALILWLAAALITFLSSCRVRENQQEFLPAAEDVGEPQPRASDLVLPELLPSPEQIHLNEESAPNAKQLAKFESLEIVDPDTSPKLRLTGHLSDGATNLDEPQFKTQNGILHITINTWRDPEAIATMAVVPFDIIIDLPIPLPAQIFLNGRPIISSTDP
jgi:hypothetical protein